MSGRGKSQRSLDIVDAAVRNHAIEIEAAETQSMAEFMSKWPGISMPANKYTPGTQT